MLTKYKCIPNESDIKTNPLLSISGGFIGHYIVFRMSDVSARKIKNF